MQLLKTPLFIVVTELGIVTVVKFMQLRKALSPIVVTELGIVTLDKDSHLKKALLPICTTAQTCTVCGTELVAALGHDYKDKKLFGL